MLSDVTLLQSAIASLVGSGFAVYLWNIHCRMLRIEREAERQSKQQRLLGVDFSNLIYKEIHFLREKDRKAEKGTAQ